jgi:hypothetical protein
MTRKRLTAAALSLLLTTVPFGLADTAYAKSQGGHGHAATRSTMKGHAAKNGGGKWGGGKESGDRHAGGDAGGHGSDGLGTARTVLGVVSGLLGR